MKKHLQHLNDREHVYIIIFNGGYKYYLKKDHHYIVISVGNKRHVPFYIPFAPQILHKPLFQMLLGVLHFPKSVWKQ